MAMTSPARADVLGNVGQHLDQVGTGLGQVGSEVGKNIDGKSARFGVSWGRRAGNRHADAR